jgi:hypothetical protein
MMRVTEDESRTFLKRFDPYPNLLVGAADFQVLGVILKGLLIVHDVIVVDDPEVDVGIGEGGVQALSLFEFPDCVLEESEMLVDVSQIAVSDRVVRLNSDGDLEGFGSPRILAGIMVETCQVYIACGATPTQFLVGGRE